MAENDAFFYNMDCRGQDNNCYSAIIHNIDHICLLGIKLKGIESKQYVKQLFNDLWYGTTMFTICYRVTLKGQHISGL